MENRDCNINPMDALMMGAAVTRGKNSKTRHIIMPISTHEKGSSHIVTGEGKGLFQCFLVCIEAKGDKNKGPEPVVKIKSVAHWGFWCRKRKEERDKRHPFPISFV